MGATWIPQKTPRHDTTQHNHRAAVSTGYPEKQVRTLELFLKKCSLTFQVPSETLPAERCQHPRASLQQWVLSR